jgi:hypothetical protein
VDANDFGHNARRRADAFAVVGISSTFLAHKRIEHSPIVG